MKFAGKSAAEEVYKARSCRYTGDLTEMTKSGFPRGHLDGATMGLRRKDVSLTGIFQLFLLVN